MGGRGRGMIFWGRWGEWEGGGGFFGGRWVALGIVVYTNAILPTSNHPQFSSLSHTHPFNEPVLRFRVIAKSTAAGK